MAKSRKRSRRRNRYKKQTTNRRLRFSRPIRRSVPATSVDTLGRDLEPATRSVKRIRVKKVIQRVPKKIKKVSKRTLTNAEINRRIICNRRSIRKEIIHATGKAGLSGQRRPNLKNRNIKC
mgnify:CR=1 FL=1